VIEKKKYVSYHPLESCFLYIKKDFKIKKGALKLFKFIQLKVPEITARVELFGQFRKDNVDKKKRTYIFQYCLHPCKGFGCGLK
jgi:hypothetical protein